MRILMIAPQPFMEERGAPFAIYHHIKALLMMGYEVDLVTYHIGKPVDLPGLHMYRIPALPGIKQVKVGPSLAKIPLGMLVFLLSFWRMCVGRYDYLHTHEEGGMMGIILSALFGPRHLYYMHSDLSQQIVSSEFIEHPLLVRAIEAVQGFMVRSSDAVIAICPDIEKSARRMAPNTPIYMIENCAVDEALPNPDPAEVARLCQSLQLSEGPIMLYTGTLESYQGIDMLIQSIPAVKVRHPDVCYLIVGGQPAQVEKYRAMAQELGVGEATRFVGLRPLAEMPLYMAMADVLLSPRSKGTNTPLKLYTYLRSGKPMLATAIYSQTQVLTPETAMLVPPTAEGLAQGALELLRDPVRASAMAERGQVFAEEHYSWRAFLKQSLEAQQDFAAVEMNAQVAQELA